jgi:geranylgeranyl diphosphate synthase type II
MEYASEADKQKLAELFSTQLEDSTAKITEAKEIFVNSGASAATKKAIEEYTFKAFELLDQMNIKDDKRQILRAFGENLMGRKV